MEIGRSLDTRAKVGLNGNQPNAALVDWLTASRDGCPISRSLPDIDSLGRKLD